MGKPELPYARWSQREPRVCGWSVFLAQHHAAAVEMHNCFCTDFWHYSRWLCLARDHGEDGEDTKSWDGGNRHDYMLYVDNI